MKVSWLCSRMPGEVFLGPTGWKSVRLPSNLRRSASPPPVTKAGLSSPPQSSPLSISCPIVSFSCSPLSLLLSNQGQVLPWEGLALDSCLSFKLHSLQRTNLLTDTRGTVSGTGVLTWALASLTRTLGPCCLTCPPRQQTFVE